MTLGEAEWLELRLEVDGLGCRGDDKNKCMAVMKTSNTSSFPHRGFMFFLMSRNKDDLRRI